MAAQGLHISISAETIANPGGFPISNSMFTSLVVSGLLIIFAVLVRINLARTNRPTGLQNIAEWLIESFSGLIDGVTNSAKRTKQFLPLIVTFFLFILLNNWMGLLPGVGTIGFIEGAEGEKHAVLLPSTVAMTGVTAQAAEETITHEASLPATDEETIEVTEEHSTAPIGEEHAPSEVSTQDHEAVAETHQVFVPYFRAGTADLNTTIALATISVLATQFFGFMYLKIGYLSKFFNFSSPINFAVGLLELVLEAAKVISFAFRLFGNIFAGEVLLAVITFLVPIVVPMPFYGLEVAVGAIQALVFSMLSIVFFNMATVSHSEH